MNRVLSSILSTICFLVLPFSVNATFIDAVDVYTVGTSTTINWQHYYDGSESPEASATLAIVAEGVDAPGPGGGENDRVFFNGVLLGELDQQPFYYSGFGINPGPGALGAPRTELTTSIFYLNPAWLLTGWNSISVIIDPANWIMEVETSTLTVNSVPEPSPLLLMIAGLAGLAGLGFASRKKMSA
ncbi:MAG: PEP-CTERM sorting domain-containing protein [Candidatus Thiodiazotropha sp. (ex Myrtea spinifera)]|nr:PEP-CTERM sorting domain-containing protein [Candidatus Thiodiazotropha sp. (ex Myrtea spinifera)]